MDLVNEFAIRDNATVDDAPNIGAEILWRFGQETGARYTIAIPTYGRPDRLITAVRSAIGQTYSQPLDIIIIDNSHVSRAEDMSAIKSLNLAENISLTYYRNHSNVGMYRNINRCLTFCDTPFITILHDDDELDADFIKCMDKYLASYGDIGAIYCRFRIRNSKFGWGSNSLHLARSTVINAIRRLFTFGFLGPRKIGLEQLFWANVVGSGLGMVVRREVALRLGGYNVEFHPISDYWFNIRLCHNFVALQIPRCLATLNIAVNESLKQSTAIETLKFARQVRLFLCDSGLVPSTWRRHIQNLTWAQLKYASRNYRQSRDFALTSENAVAVHGKVPSIFTLASRIMHAGF